MLAGYGADEEEAKACAFDFDLVCGVGAIEALEDSFEFVGGDPEAFVCDRDDGVGVFLDAEAAGDGDAVGGVFDGVVEEVEDGGA